MPTDSNASSRKRILLITVRADHGGGPRHVLDLLKSFQNSGYEFYIGSPDQEPYASQFQALTKKFFEIPPRSFSPFALFRLMRVVKRARIDIVHSHGRGAGIYSRLVGLFTGCTVLHTFHGIHRDPTLTGRVKLWADKVLSFFPFTPIFVSENEGREALGFGSVRPRTKGFVVENAVDLSRFKLRKVSPLADSANVVQFGGFTRADLAKGPDLFLHLAKELRSSGKWACAGISTEELASFGTIPQSLNVGGKIREPAAWLQSLDVFVSTARNEGLPLGVLEAMAAGCLCILSNIPAHFEFEKRGAALLFNANEPQSFFEIWSRLAADQTRRDEQLAAATRLLREKHSLEIFREKLEAVYARF